jgi:pyridoxamine 5'-phosphate oxidase
MKKPSIANLHRNYPDKQLLEKTAPRDPFRLFHHWFQQALQAHLLDPNAMALSTVSPSGRPSARMVLLKGLDQKGFVFFTNYLSRKGKDLKAHPSVSLLFFWPELGRQVRVEGKAVRVPAKESDEYFKTRPLGSQLSAWASHQSAVIPNRDVLEKRMKELERQFRHKMIPRPPHWGGYRVLPSLIEFWSGRRNRLHDRLRYQKKNTGGWRLERLAP